MFILKAYRNGSTFEQQFEFEGAFQDKMKWLQNNGWTIGEAPRVSFLHGVH